MISSSAKAFSLTLASLKSQHPTRNATIELLRRISDSIDTWTSGVDMALKYRKSAPIKSSPVAGIVQRHWNLCFELINSILVSKANPKSVAISMQPLHWCWYF